MYSRVQRLLPKVDRFTSQPFGEVRRRSKECAPCSSMGAVGPSALRRQEGRRSSRCLLPLPARRAPLPRCSLCRQDPARSRRAARLENPVGSRTEEFGTSSAWLREKLSVRVGRYGCACVETYQNFIKPDPHDDPLKCDEYNHEDRWHKKVIVAFLLVVSRQNRAVFGESGDSRCRA